MTTISGFADGILDGTIPKEKEMEYIAVISSETHRLSRLVRGMLDMSQLTAKDPAVIRSMSFDITELIYQALLSLEQKINEMCIRDRCIRFVTIKKKRSRRHFMISHAAGRQGSASSRKKSEVKHV